MTLAGTYHVVSSGLTNAPIRYFRPHEASRLLPLLQLGGARAARPIPLHEAIAYFVYLTQIGALTLRFAAPAAIRAHFFRAHPVVSEGFLLEGAASVIGKPVTIRDTIAFSGGSSPSVASHIYTPPAEVGRLFADFARTIDGMARDADAVGAATFAHLYALLLHPLIDGNGRWARWLAICVANRLGNSFSALPALCLFYRNERSIIESLRLGGVASIQALIDRSARAASLETASGTTSIAAIRRMTERLSEWLSESDQMCIAVNALLSPSIDTQAIASLLKCSKRKAETIWSIFDEGKKTGAHVGGEGGILRVLKVEMSDFFLDEKEFK